MVKAYLKIHKSDVAFNKMTQSMLKHEGPLNHLTNNWTFSDKNNGITEVTFDIDFEIKNKFLNSLMVVLSIWLRKNS